jgi:hypothetical protein
MFVLGLLLILLSAGAAVAVLGSGTDEQAVLFDGSLEMPTLVVFLAGVVALLLFGLGLELVRGGVKRANRNRRTAKKLRKLERREHERRGREEPSTGTTVADRDPAPTAPADSSTGTPTTREEDRDTGPYQAPPPPSR